jgi:hypothetical protein
MRKFILHPYLVIASDLCEAISSWGARKVRSTFVVVLILGIVLAGCRNQSVVVPASQPSSEAATPEPVATAILKTSLPIHEEPIATLLPAIEPVVFPTQPPYLPALPVWGIEHYSLSADAGLDLITQSGAFWVRRNALLWSEVETEKGMRKWQAVAGLDGELKAAADQGLQVILVVRSTPPWAQSLPGSYCSPPTAESLDAFGAFLYDAVRRYSLPPYNVQYWEIGNEPDVASGVVPSEAPFGCWGTDGDPYYGGEFYAEILKSIYPQIKAANPQAQVLVGGLLLDCDPVNPPEIPSGSGQQKDCTPARYLEGVLKNGGADYFDGVSFHGYDYYAGNLGAYGNGNWNSAWNTTGPVSIAKASYLRSLMNLYGVTGKYLMNTEAALICGRDGSEAECQGEEFNLTKAYFLAQSYVVAIAEHLTANIWYNLTGWRATGLVDNQMQPNLAYQAFSISSDLLGGAGYVGPLDNYPGVRGYVFDRNGVPLWVLWSLDGENHDIRLEKAPLSVTNVFGEALAPAQELTVTLAPIYVTISK